ncbi:MAG: glycosyltransferase [Candidatus Omnitrophica bacterium]|nr:glycosyltransferase [Candidatus Omnitrophota bacterium]
MIEPSVTVLMTVYNGEGFLRQAVESVLKQTYTSFEFLIVDDASTDASLEILNSYHDPRIRIVQNSVNQGQAASLNIGLRAATGTYIARIDADDIALAHWLECQVQAARRNPECLVISSWACIVNKEGVVKQLLEIPLTHEGMLLRSLTASPINHGGSLLKRADILRYGGYDESFRALADYDLWTRLLQVGARFSSGKKILMAVRVHGGSISKAEKDRAVAETKRVFFRHILFLTGIDLTDRQLSMLWELCYRADEAPLKDMEEAIVLLRGVYEGLKLPGLSRAVIMDHWRQRANVFYIKKIFACLSRCDRSGVREVCRQSECYCGPSIVMRLLDWGSFLGFAGMIIPSFFIFVRRQWAVIVLRNCYF